jgi:hypothetical protein
VDEPKSPEPASGRRQTGLPPSVRLSPMQEAWRAYVEHTLYHCDTCRRVDGSPCPPAEDLYRTWRRVAEESIRKVWGTPESRAALPPGQ